LRVKSGFRDQLLTLDQPRCMNLVARVCSSPFTKLEPLRAISVLVAGISGLSVLLGCSFTYDAGYCMTAWQSLRRIVWLAICLTDAPAFAQQLSPARSKNSRRGPDARSCLLRGQLPASLSARNCRPRWLSPFRLPMVFSSPIARSRPVALHAHVDGMFRRLDRLLPVLFLRVHARKMIFGHIFCKP